MVNCFSRAQVQGQILQMDLATGYFNLPDRYIKSLCHAGHTNLVSLLCAAPQVSLPTYFRVCIDFTFQGKWIFHGSWSCQNYSCSILRASLASASSLFVCSFHWLFFFMDLHRYHIFADEKGLRAFEWHRSGCTFHAKG